MSKSQDSAKEEAAIAALGYVEKGMKLGLGTGSTAEFFVRALSEKAARFNIRATTTSERTEALAKSLGIALFPLAELAPLDLTVDGADELDEHLTLIKGGGGALLREKIVASASRKMIVIADDKKLVTRLGAFPLPIEVVVFGWQVTAQQIEEHARRTGCKGKIERRVVKDGSPFITDNGNYILDCTFGSIPDAKALAAQLGGIPGVVEHGLFIDIATLALIGGEAGVRVMTASSKDR